MKPPLLAGDHAVSKFLRSQASDLHISQRVGRKALARLEQAEPGDADLSLHDIEQDEATRAPAHARKQRRLARARRVKAQRRFARMNAKQLIAARASTPAPSRGAARLATRLIAEHEAEAAQEAAA